jgi:hypothetical protein
MGDDLTGKKRHTKKHRVLRRMSERQRAGRLAATTQYVGLEREAMT